MNRAEIVFEKLAINSTPVMRLAVRLRKLYGLGTEEAISMAKKTEKAVKPDIISRMLGAKTNNRLDILQNELKNVSRPLQRGADKNRFPVIKVYENDKLVSKTRDWKNPKRYIG